MRNNDDCFISSEIPYYLSGAMAVETQNLIEFLDTVCQYMETWYSCDDVKDNFTLDELCEEPHADFKKMLKVLYRALDPLHREWFNNFFTPDTIEWKYVHSLLSAHSFALVKRYRKSIFICLMYICSFTYSLLDYCDRKGLEGRLSHIKSLISEQFLKHIKDRFVFKGNWCGLKRFCQRENLPRLLQIISDCYCEVAILHTYVLSNTQVYDFGFHGKDIINKFLSNIQTFEASVLEAFKYDMYVNPDYESEVRRAFLKLCSNLEKAPSHSYLLNDFTSLAVSPASPLAIRGKLK